MTQAFSSRQVELAPVQRNESGILSIQQPRDRAEPSIGETVVPRATIRSDASAAAISRLQVHSGRKIDHFVFPEKSQTNASASEVCRVLGPALSVRPDCAVQTRRDIILQTIWADASIVTYTVFWAGAFREMESDETEILLYTIQIDASEWLCGSFGMSSSCEIDQSVLFDGTLSSASKASCETWWTGKFLGTSWPQPISSRGEHSSRPVRFRITSALFTCFKLSNGRCNPCSCSFRVPLSTRSCNISALSFLMRLVWLDHAARVPGPCFA